MLFEDIYQVKKLLSYVLLSKKMTSQTACAMLCNRHPYCLSFNYCGNLVCELNFEDIFSIQNGEKQLQDYPFCVYGGMKREHFPSFTEGESELDIQDDEWEGKCVLRHKRVDLEWGAWDTAISDVLINDTDPDYIRYHTRETVINVAHGGVPGSERSRIFSWIRWIRTKKTWTDAKQNCEQLGGKLFYNLDGTIEQLLLFHGKFNGERNW